MSKTPVVNHGCRTCFEVKLAIVVYQILRTFVSLQVVMNRRYTWVNLICQTRLSWY